MGFLEKDHGENNILVAFETLNHMKMTKVGRVGYVALKLDMSKAYDRLEWGFLKKIMEKMGFHPTWIGWIMECIQSVTYSILVNGEPNGHIIPSRGIHQGDPLSPYLFLLCSEDLNGIIQHSVDGGQIEGFLFVVPVQRFLTYFLQMIVSFFVGLR